MKELHTGAILLKGHTKDEVYEWSIFSSPTAPLVVFSSVKTSSSEWHHRLGHPIFPILKHIVSHYQLDLSSFLFSQIFCVMLVIAIKAINYLSLHLLLSPLNHLKLFSLMCGLPLLSPITVLNIMSYLLISTSLNTFGFIPFNRNLKLKTC